MNRDELAKRLEKEGFNKFVYWLDESSGRDGYCMDYSYGTWRVYFFERGTTYNETLFENEESACDYFYKEISKDPVAKN